MRASLVLILIYLLTFPTASVHAVCNMPRPVYPKGEVEGGARTPKDEGENSPDPTAPPRTDPGSPSPEIPPETESPDPKNDPRPRPPSVPGAGLAGPGGAAPSGGISGGRPSPGRRGGAGSLSRSWYLWWELNRESLLGLRTAMRGREAVSGDADPVAAYREGVRKALREFAEKPVSDKVKASTLRALGRAGTDEDARRFLALLEAKGTNSTVREGAAIGLGLLPAITDAAIRDQVRAFASRLTNGKTVMKGRTRQLAIMTLGLRARHDPFLAAGLGALRLSAGLLAWLDLALL